MVQRRQRLDADRLRQQWLAFFGRGIRSAVNGLDRNIYVNLI